jgi:hypothetical protein
MRGKREQSLSRERLDELVEEATVDAHDEAEQAMDSARCSKTIFGCLLRPRCSA